jgi:phosphate transport system substrate-binding protein
MKILGKATYLGLALVLASCAGGIGQPSRTADALAGNYLTKGGGGALDSVKALTEAFTAQHPNVVFQGFEDVSSDASIVLAAGGDIDLGFISREPTDKEKATVDVVPIGNSGTAVGVNASNPVKMLTKDQVAKVFTGQITDWKDVGGNPGKIRVLLREPGSATRSTFEKYFFGSAKPTYAKDGTEVYEIDETMKAISSFKDSIGMMSMVNLTFANPGIKMIGIDGVAAARETLRSGTYPIRRPLYIVYGKDPATVKPAIKAFVDWVKGPEGQKVLAGL